jgi:hypothetical protein
MLKLGNKIIKSAAYLVLISILIITITNAIHFHKIELGNSSSILIPVDRTKNFHYYLNGDIDFCPIQTAYNTLQNTIIPFSNPYQIYEKKIDVIDIFIVSPKPLKSTTLNYSLRAPPKISSI